MTYTVEVPTVEVLDIGTLDEGEVDPAPDLDVMVAILLDERIHRGMTQIEVARRLGHTTQSAVWQWESGMVKPSLSSLRAWAAVFDMEPQIVSRSPRRRGRTSWKRATD